MNLSDRIREVLPHMSEGDKEILRSMREKSKAYGGKLTQGQLVFVDKIIARSKPQAERETIDLSRINSMFERAAQSLKNPKVSFLTDNAGEFDVTRAKDGSRNPGFLYVKTGATYLGKISPRGEFSPSRDADETVGKSLRVFAADPVSAAAAYGAETSKCCFCRKTLTDGRSVAVGYGPICADNFGLPWGE